MSKQLTIDGREVAHPPNRSRRLRALSRAHVRILRVLAREGSIRSVEAGVIVHQTRGSCAFQTRANQWPMQGIACCPYAGKDGNAAMKRLLEAGRVIRGPKIGTWIAKPATTREGTRGQHGEGDSGA